MQPVGQLCAAKANRADQQCQKCIHLQRTPDIGGQRPQKGRALAAADFQPLLPHQHQIILHALDVAQIDKVALVAPGKVVGNQIFFGLLQAAPYRPSIGSCVVVQKTVTGLQIQNIVGVQ